MEVFIITVQVVQNSIQTFTHLKKGALDAIPISISTFIFGSVFGMVAVHSGLNILESSMMSFVSFAGSAQLSILELLGNSSIFTIFIMTFLLNSRHLLYGLTLSPYLNDRPKSIVNTIAFLLSDSLFVLTNLHLKKGKLSPPYMISAGMVVYLAWGIGTWIGAYFSKFMGDNTYGLEFASTACFILLVFSEITSKRRMYTLMICAIFVLVCYHFFPTGVLLLLAGLVAFAFGYFSNEDV